MEYQDLILTPVYLILIYGIAYWMRPYVTTKTNKKYFIPALNLKIFGAIGIGLIYQFYYGNGSPTGSGDTFLYYYHVKVLYKAFLESPTIWLKFMLSNGEFDPETYKYTSLLEWYRAPTEFIIVKFASFFSILCFNTYTVIAICFGFLSFTGMWRMYLVFFKIYPTLHKEFAIATFFLPSVFFWGSGLMKDSLAIGALGWVFYGFYQLCVEKKRVIQSILIIIIAGMALQAIKVYILLSFVFPALYWFFNIINDKIRSKTIRSLTKPFAIILGLGVAVLGASGLTEENSKYDIEKLGEQSKINSIYLSKGVKTGSAYDIGIFDGSLPSLLTVGPQAVVVSLYRPFIWEVRNPVMLLSALEASTFIYLTLMIFFKMGFFKTLKVISSQSILTFCFLFSIILAFGVGTNSGNFGTLVRYKIPIMPFYMAGVFMLRAHLKRPRKKISLIKANPVTS